MPAGDVQLSVIIPAYNEAQGIGRTLGAVTAYLEARGGAWEVIVAADGTDGTREAAATSAGGDARVTVIGSPQRGGKGKGIRGGVAIAAGRVIGFVDADYKTPIEEADKLLPSLEQGYDIVIGSRAMAESDIVRAQPLHRRLGSKAFAVVMRSLTGIHGIRDTQCGFKFFRRSVAKDLFSISRIDGYMFDVEVLRLAMVKGYRVREIGVRWQDDGDSRFSPLAGGSRVIKELLKIRMMNYEPAALRPVEQSRGAMAGATSR